MKRSTKTILTISALALLLCGCRGGRGRGGDTTSSDAPSDTVPSGDVSGTTTTQVTSDPGDYYNGISDSLTGTALITALNSLNNTKRTKQVGYTEMLSKPAQGVYVTDPGASGNKYSVTSFYSGTERKGVSGMNREHVWPNSRGGNLVEDDIHMIRPTITAENGSRGNSFYVQGKKTEHDGWDPAMEDFGEETYRGDCARIIFYAAIAAPSLTLVDKETDATSNNTMGKLSDLLRWNLNYNVKDRENIRNVGAQSLQGNRNPFIDHPEYACRIWGSTNSTTKSICGM